MKENSRATWARVRSAFVRLATGGDWAISQPDTTRRNLVWFWFDGFFASAADNIVVSYLVVYLVALGATQGQIGLMSSLSSLAAALVLLPGAMMVERMGSRRGLVLVGGGWARFALLMLAALPLLLGGSGLIIAAIAFSISRDAMANISYPAWMSLTGDVVPMEGRGRFFASRNFIMSVSGIIITFLAGQLITRMAPPVGYQVAFFIAFLVGLMSVFSFSRIVEPNLPLKYPQVRERLSLRVLLNDLTSNREFLTFAAITALWNFSLNIAGPFFTVYLVQNLHADAAMVGYTAIGTSVAAMLAQRKMGELNDRWGPQRLAVISGLLIPVLPWFWLLFTAPWQVIPTNMLSGVLWAGYNLATFNYLLLIIDPARRARYSALFQITVTISLAAGAAVGSLLVTYVGYPPVFIWSGIGRLAAALLFAFFTARHARRTRQTQRRLPEE